MNPEFDEINDALLADLVDNDDNDIYLECDKCGQEYEFAIEYMDGVCSEPGCDGWLVLMNGESPVINIPDTLKNGTAWGSSTPGSSGGQTNNWGNSAGYGTTTYKSCDHPGKKVIFEFSGRKLYASNYSTIDEASGRWELIIDLAGVVTVPNTVEFVSAKAPKRFRELAKLTLKEKELPSEVLRLHWTDMGIPPVGLNFWQELWNQLPEKTVIACHGGHGRTGTCLAALMITAGVDYYSAVETVRQEHCSKAIETIGQEKYLHKLYVEYLYEQLNAAGEHQDTLKVAELKAEIEYADKNPPTNVVSNYTAAAAPAPNTSITTAPKEGKLVKYYGPEFNYPQLIIGTPLAEAVSTKRYVKTVDGVVWIEECNDTKCTVLNCNDNRHQKWVMWNESNTKIEFDAKFYAMDASRVL